MKMLTCPKRRLLCTGAEIISTQAMPAAASARRRGSTCSTPPST
jgi:hypothetical protein